MADQLQIVKPSPTRRAGFEWPHFAGWQWNVLVLLTLINLLNYFDRLIVIPMFPFLRDEFGVSDFRLGLLASVFIFVNSLAVLPFGFWSDRGSRRKIMAFGVLFWSLSTWLSGLATSFRGLLAARALVGVGEGAYAPAGTAIISEAFPPEYRARVQSVFNLGMLVGGVMGLAAGGVLSQWIGWRWAFFLVGLPGFVLAILVFRMRLQIAPAVGKAPPIWTLLKIPAYPVILLGGMFVVFSGAAFVTWGPEFGMRYHDLTVEQASAWMGLVVLGGSISGVLLGGAIADRLQARWSWGRALTIAVSLLAGTPFLYEAITVDSLAAFFACLFFASFLLTCYHGPATAVIHDLTPEQEHGFAFALYLFVIHLFGDTMAPALVGRVSDISELRRGLLFGVVADFIGAMCFFVVAWMIYRSTLRKPVL
jgi:predicted MFS family arabinose efflux permease